MQIVSTIMIPALVIFMMTGLGLERSVRDLRWVGTVVPLFAWSRRKDSGYAAA